MEETLNSITSIANRRIFRYHSIISVERVLLGICIFGTALSRVMLNRIIFVIIGLGLMFLDAFGSKAIYTYKRIRDSALYLADCLEPEKSQKELLMGGILKVLNRSSIYTIIMGVFLRDNNITGSTEKISYELLYRKHRLKRQSFVIGLLLLADMIMIIQPMIYSGYFYIIRFALTTVLFSLTRFSICNYMVEYLSISKVFVPTESETNK